MLRKIYIMRVPISLSFMVILTGLIVLLGGGKVLAATGEWKYSNTIVVGGVEYTDSDVGDSMDYYPNGEEPSDSNCVNEIRGFNRDYSAGPDFSNAKIIIRTEGQYGDCNEREEDLTLTRTDNATAFLRWVDSGRIEVIPGTTFKIVGGFASDVVSAAVIQDGIFVQADGNPSEYVLTSGQCRSSIVVPNGTRGNASTSGEGTLILRTTSCDSPDGDQKIPVRIAAAEKSADPAGSGTATGVNGGLSGEANNETESCEEMDNFAWIGCPFLRGIDGALNWIESNVVDILVIEPEAYENNVRDAWVVFRNVASILLVIVMLFMVLSTALGFDFVDAYTIKKILPKLVAGVILIQLSWILMTFAITVVNAIGNGMFGLMLAPFGGPEATDLPSLVINSDGGGGFFNGLFIVGAAGAGVALGFLGLLSLAFTTFLAVFLGFFILVLRNIVIILTLIVAPLAIVAWITPGTNKLWALWWDGFTKALLMFPFIMMLFAAGRIFAWVTVQSGEGQIGPGFVGEGIQLIIVVIAYAIPYFAIPFTLRFAGGLVATLGGMANDQSKGIFDRNQKYRQAKTSENIQKSRAGIRFNDRGLGRISNRAIGSIANPVATRGGLSRSRFDAIKGSRGAAMTAEELKSDAVYQANQNDDKFLLALGNRERAEQEMKNATGSSKTAWQTALTNASLVKSRNSDATKLSAINAVAATGYQHSYGRKGYNELAEDIAKVTGTSVQYESDGNGGYRTDANGNKIFAGVSGSDSARGAFANAMNSAQYGLKNAQRFDLAGINDGTSYSLKGGTDKATGFDAGRAKAQTHTAGASEFLGATIDADGKTAATPQEIVTQMQANSSLKIEDVKYHYQNLVDAASSPNAKNRPELDKQKKAIEDYATITGNQELARSITETQSRRSRINPDDAFGSN